ncbi:ComEC/Rec2 family competence protein [Rhizobium ruizarguesonis]|uniref:hypothetical protein n=1 Tax=Rhizobium ruizarguesonis TaxID=2081791 RepID=UPI00103252CD|nr:hypothetical protein [Rhizobium ruizarguesonis]TAT71056.1 hypothetical protein ELI52_36430 [Rhizobium ruizarguesonis]
MAKTSTQKASGTAGETKTNRAPSVPTPVMTVRHYCQGLGDCHLIRIKRKGPRDFFMLIDCGVHSSVTGGPGTIDAIVSDILTVTKKIDVLVVTHEHVDHVSGFLSAAKKFAEFEEIGEVWMGWTENPADPQARQLDKFKGQAIALLSQASQRLAAVDSKDDYMANVRDGVRSILGFNFGVKGERVRKMRDEAGKLAKTQPPVYLEPGSLRPAIPGLDHLRIYVLGPPRDPALLKVTDRQSEMYSLASATAAPIAAALQGSFALTIAGDQFVDDPAAPFDCNVGLPLDKALSGDLGDEHEHAAASFLAQHYSGPLPAPPRARRQRKPTDPNVMDQSWRRIDHDWLAMSSTLAMQLDDQTNNTSVVLAFENIKTGRVMLFAADAQIGSWLSWQDLTWDVGTGAVTGPDLLARTVFYKVGHHGSKNATAQAKGLELMTSPDLSAFIPTNQKDAKKVGWGEMPFHGILEALEKKTNGRAVRADDAWLGTGTLPPALQKPSGSLQAVHSDSRLWVEFDLA